MPTTLTAVPTGAVLSVDFPTDDAFDRLQIWVGTTAGFTPSSSNLVWDGKATSVRLADLTPAVTYYVKYAFVSSVDSSVVTIQGPLSVVPLSIPGTLIADSFRGKKIIGGWFADAGTQFTASYNPLASPDTTRTLAVEDTTDFQSSGVALILSAATNLYHYIRYTGKTATTFTGVQGLISRVAKGDIIVPITVPMIMFESYSGGDITMENGSASSFNGYPFPASGNAIAFNGHNADPFTFTASDTSYISGITGLANRAVLSRRDRQFVAFDNGLPIVTFPGTTVTSINVGAAISLFSDTEGEFWAFSTTATFVLRGKYHGKSGNTLQVASTFGSALAPMAGDYYIVPITKGIILGAGFSIFTYDNFGASYMQPENLSTRSITSSATGDIAIRAQSYGGYPAFNAYSANAWPYSANLLTALPGAGDKGPGDFGIYYNPTSNYTHFGYETYGSGVNAGTQFFQEIGLRQHFKLPTGGATDSYIDFNDSTNTYSFTASGTLGDANIVAAKATISGEAKADTVVVGTSPSSASRGVNITKTFTANGSRQGIWNDMFITHETITAARVWYGHYNSVEIDFQNSTTFNNTAYGIYNIIQADQGSNTPGFGDYQVIQCNALISCNDATFNRFDDVRSVNALVTLSGDTARIARSYGLFCQINASGTSATPTVAIDDAYGVYINFIASQANRTVTNAYQLYLASSGGLAGLGTNRWGIYQSTDWQNYLNGSLQLTKALAVKPTSVTAANGGTTNVAATASRLYLNHTATIAGHTITLPATSGIKDGHELIVGSRSAVTTLTINGNGATVRGAPTTIAADGFFTLIWSVDAACWFRAN